MERRSLEDIYEQLDRDIENESYDKEDLKLKDQKPFIIIGRSVNGNILLRIGDELGYDVTKSLTYGEALKLCSDLLNTVIEKYAK
tara:strand:- start:455 stop:709 length:255 start_codon:yes stop_codon:yes gene_type:complete